MRKDEAIAVLGGTISSAADAIGVSYQAIVKWPDELPPRLRDRVQAALWRRQNVGPTPVPARARKEASANV